MGTTIFSSLLSATPNLKEFLSQVCQTGNYSVYNWQNSWCNDWCSNLQYTFIIARPVPSEEMSNVFTHPLSCNIGIHIGNGKAKWLNKEIGQGLTTHHNRWWHVTWCCILAIVGVYPPPGREQAESGRWDTYQRIEISSSWLRFGWSCSFYS